MASESRIVRIPAGSPESRAFANGVERAMALTEELNQLGYGDQDAVLACFATLIGAPAPEGFRLAPPFFTDGGRNIRIGRHVFINQHCTIYDLAPVTIGDGVLIGPNVSLITTSHPVAPSQRLTALVAEPIDIGSNVWIATGATVIGGVRIGDNSVVAAGAVVTSDVPADTLVGGNPAWVIRSIAED